MTKTKSIQVKEDTHAQLTEKLGYNGCLTIDDVIKYLLKEEKDE